MSRRQQLTDAVVTRARRRTAFGGVATGLLVGTLGLTAGPIGGAVGLLVAGGWLVLPAPYVLVGGHLGLLVLPESPGRLQLALVEVGFAGLLVGAQSPFTEQWRLAGWLGLVGVLIGGIAWLLLANTPLWLTTVVIVATLVVGSYAVHRYELAHLNSVSNDI